MRRCDEEVTGNVGSETVKDWWW